jgi:general L-amino acid transport system substrate-binding protein
MRRLVLPLLLALLACGARAEPAAVASPVLDRVRAAGVVHCGAPPRPGLAFVNGDHDWFGLEVDICRALAVAVLGDPDRVAFHAYTIPQDLGRLREGTDDVAFVTAGDLMGGLALGEVLPGPTVYIVQAGIMVRDENPARHVADLAGKMICGEPGSAPERALDTYFRAHALPLNFSMWQEAEEMMDAFDVGRCPAVVQEVPALAALRLNSEAQDHPARLLPERMGGAPVMAATGLDDSRWSAIVAWTVHTLIQADRHAASNPNPAEIRAEDSPMVAPDSALGLAPGWQGRVVAAVGSYARIYARSLGDESPLALPPGVNAGLDRGGVLSAPASE